MKESKFKPKMMDELKSRKNNMSWNKSIVSNVLERKKVQKKQILFTFSSSAFAFAATILIIFQFTFNPTVDPLQYKTFITEQIEGSYQRSQGKTTDGNTQNIEESNSEYVVFSNDIDDIIKESLAIR